MMRIFVFALLALGMSGEAWADCTSPAGKEGEQVYASGQKTMVYCNGTDWMAMGSSSTGGGGVSGNISVSNISVTTNVSVTGTVSMGWERVAGSAGSSSTASCSAGKFVMGGGCYSANMNCMGYTSEGDPMYDIGAISGYPSSSTAYYCSGVCKSGYPATPTFSGSVTAYAICARLN